MGERDDLATELLPSAVASASHVSYLSSHRAAADHDDPRLSVRRSESPLHDRQLSTHHLANKAEHFRRLEDRMDELQRQVSETQRMVGELSAALRKPSFHEASEPPTARIRENVRAPSGNGLLSTRGPVGSGPPLSIPIVTTFLSAMAASGSNRDLGHSQPMADDENDGDGDETQSPELAGLADRFSLPAHSKTASSRKLSASNPVALLPARDEQKRSVSMAVAHAAAFVAEVAKARGDKKKNPTQIFPTLQNDATGGGPVLSRRFSISSLDQVERPHQDNSAAVLWLLRWPRNMFRGRTDTAVSPQEVLAARAAHAKLHPLTINHDSVKRAIWDSIVILMIVVDIVVTPLSLSFRYFPSGMNAYNALGNVIFASDFAINMLSSYTTPRGELVSGPRHTIRHYFFSPWALPDLLSWFPFELFVNSQQGRFLGIAKVIRLAKVSQLARRFHSAKKAGFFRSVKLLGTVFIVSHLLSCYWNSVATRWRVEEAGYLDMTLGQQYAHCWSLVIGCLNASPPQMYSTIEEVSVAIFMLIGNVLQASVFGSVAVLIQSFDEEEVAYTKKLISTYERCRFLDIPEPLARRIQGYYENLYQETRSVNPDADAFINELSPALICEVKFQLYRDMIKQIPFLSAQNINPVVIEMLILHLRTVIYMQDDVLIRKGEVGDWMGFIGSKGSVGVLDPKSEARKIIRILRKGDYFGEMALLQRAKRSTTAIALTWVQIHVLCRNDLDDVKDQYPEQAEILEEEITKYMQTKVTYK